MSTQYEVEHNIKASDAAPRRKRQLDMSTFNAHLHQIDLDAGGSTTHNNPHATPTPQDLATMYRLVQDQMGTLARDAPSAGNRAFLLELAQLLDEDVEHPPYEFKGVSQQFLDGLDRVPRKQLKEDEQCPICAECFLDDKYPLVVELPCHHSHRFDLECVAPWLQSKGTCPMCRKEMNKPKPQPKKPAEEEEEEDYDDFYA